ncbi:hypothetical protein D9M69_500220 [compost metagenome]
MLTDAILAFLHFLAIFVLITLMAAEAVALRPDLTPATVRRLSLYDLFYFLSAMLALATGLLRLFYGAKGVDFYLHCARCRRPLPSRAGASRRAGCPITCRRRPRSRRRGAGS